MDYKKKSIKYKKKILNLIKNEGVQTGGSSFNDILNKIKHIFFKDTIPQEPSVHTLKPYLGGPVSFTYITIPNEDKKILLLGDQHTYYKFKELPHVIEINPFLDFIIRSSKGCVDLFIESPAYKWNKNSDSIRKRNLFGKTNYDKWPLRIYHNPLKAVRGFSESCQKHSEIKCEYDNLRMHNFDFRFRLKNNKLLEVNSRFWLNSILTQNYVYKYKKNLKKKEIIDHLLGFKKNQDVDDLIIYFKFNKSLLYFNIKIIKKTYNKLPNRFKNTFYENFVKVMDIIDIYEIFLSCQTDFYTLCRMFINFDRMSLSKNIRNVSKCNLFGSNNYQTPKNIIVYAGDGHIRNYIRFIEFTFNEKPKYRTPEYIDRKRRKKKKKLQRLIMNQLKIL